MPQLVPFYFTNQITFVFAIMLVTLYFFSKYVLPSFVSLYSTRISINKF
uniref:ATP synthase protein 8 n=1 Tax=Arthonia kermesina TaxID=2563723 RepID=A0A4P8VVI9_9PEZI|nr:ATP synthase subunit 8 [Arthonia kermesina]